MTSRGEDTLHCSFCRKEQHEVQRLIAGPTVYICDGCVGACVDILKRDASSCCSFCGKKPKRGIRLIAGPGEVNQPVTAPQVYICHECVGICVEIISDDQKAAAAPPPGS